MTTCQIETERGTCGKDAHSDDECYDCLRSLCPEHSIQHRHIKLCMACQAKRLDYDCELPTYTVSLHIPSLPGRFA